ncbi:hypothetical protein F441_17291 [Phytophthora nicotianae CJ01A1]|uniref:Uncharacterized protein n=3 Tax=Phytophthora nicotianae TaxID=4792 RepID=W2YH81_PHYNI|nr:hypothetical protein L916_16847 [Phytophthora nicotianae]ETP06300.1 hypothetical protein F441_17291 [Phytophthora nicotianae CJ01A1]ETP34405.1 hypothetical protein F442_17276 [Phytophthora nicotianae P10297]
MSSVNWFARPHLAQLAIYTSVLVVTKNKCPGVHSREHQAAATVNTTRLSREHQRSAQSRAPANFSREIEE